MGATLLMGWFEEEVGGRMKFDAGLAAAVLDRAQSVHDSQIAVKPRTPSPGVARGKEKQ